MQREVCLLDIQLKRGILEVCVLAAMLRGETYGYQLVRDVSQYIEISESTLYPILKRLEGARCVTAYALEHNGRLRRYYRITPQGRERVTEFLKDWQCIMKVYQYIEEESGRDEG